MVGGFEAVEPQRLPGGRRIRNDSLSRDVRSKRTPIVLSAPMYTETPAAVNCFRSRYNYNKQFRNII